MSLIIPIFVGGGEGAWGSEKERVSRLCIANDTSKNVGLGKYWQDLEISEAFLISLEVSFFHGLFLLFSVSKIFTKGSRARISN